jgi:hypothetical protein
VQSIARHFVKEQILFILVMVQAAGVPFVASTSARRAARQSMNCHQALHISTILL